MNTNFHYGYFVLKDSSLILKCDSLKIRMQLHPYFFIKKFCNILYNMIL